MSARRLFIAAAFFCFYITPIHAQQPETSGTPPDAASQNIEEARLIHSVMPDYPETVKSKILQDKSSSCSRLKGWHGRTCNCGGQGFSWTRIGEYC
jgi:hypothetical protein